MSSLFADVLDGVRCLDSVGCLAGHQKPDSLYDLIEGGHKKPRFFFMPLSRVLDASTFEVKVAAAEWLMLGRVEPFDGRRL